MIATIRGQVAEKIGDTAIIELGGVGYEITLTAVPSFVPAGRQAVRMTPLVLLPKL